MVEEQTIREAIGYIVMNETKLMDAYMAALSNSLDKETTGFLLEGLLDFSKVRGHIYRLASGITEPSPYMRMSGKELVGHFSEVEKSS